MQVFTGEAASEDGLDRIRSVLIDDDEAERMAALFKLLGEPNRARLLSALVEADELCVSDLARVCDIPETGVSHALRLLRAAKVVRSRRHGRQILTRLDDDHVRALLALALTHVRHTAGRPAP